MIKQKFISNWFYEYLLDIVKIFILRNSLLPNNDDGHRELTLRTTHFVQNSVCKNSVCYYLTRGDKIITLYLSLVIVKFIFTSNKIILVLVNVLLDKCFILTLINSKGSVIYVIRIWRCFLVIPELESLFSCKIIKIMVSAKFVFILVSQIK